MNLRNTQKSPTFKKYNLALTISIVFALFFWIITLNQPLIDKHEFRQTQTALTVLFNPNLIFNFLNYKTPVLGFPWQIPFEFPLFQILVSFFSNLLPVDISLLGRLISILFGISCLIPVSNIFKIFNIRSKGLMCFYLLYFSSAIYLYWNRSFLIESTALFLSLSALLFYLKLFTNINDKELISKKITYLSLLLFLTLVLSMLVKITTAFPILLLLLLDNFRLVINDIYYAKKRRHIKTLLISIFICLASSIIYYYWSEYTQSIRLENYFTSFIKDSALHEFLFGSFYQKFSVLLWGKVVIFRCFYIVGILPFLFLTYKVLPSATIKIKLFLFYNFLLFILPLIIFTNIHIIHDYYQYSNEIYLIIFLSTIFSLSQNSNNYKLKILGHNSLSIFVISSYIFFLIYYLPSATNYKSVKLDIGNYINQNTSDDSVIVIYGDDWSSAFSYFSKRYSITYPSWNYEKYKPFEELLNDLDEHKGSKNISAIVRSKNKPLINIKKVCPMKEELNFNEWELIICNNQQK